MTAPVFNILTQKEITIDLSRSAMAHILHALEVAGYLDPVEDVQCELDNFVNTLHNLLERSEPEPKTGNLDLIGD